MRLRKVIALLHVRQHTVDLIFCCTALWGITLQEI